MGLRRLAVASTLVIPLVLGVLPADAGRSDVNGKIVFERNRPTLTEIWTMNQDGSSQHRLRVGEDPDWSRDGTQIAFARGPELFVMDADGTGERRVTMSLDVPSWARVSDPDWSPDGTQIAFGSYDGIYLVAAPGGSARRLAQAASEVAPAWSPDGSKIAFIASGAVWVMNADGSARRALPGARAGGRVAAWSPDGSRIAYADLSRGLSTVGLDGAEPVQIAAVGGIDPTWSPDGTRIAFVHTADICVVNADGSELGRLTYAPVDSIHNTEESHVDPDWQPLPEGSDSAGPPTARTGPDRSWNRSHEWRLGCTGQFAGRSLTGSAIPRRVRMGGVVTYRIHLRNRSPLPIGNMLQFAAWLDGGFRVLSTSATQGKCAWPDFLDRRSPDYYAECSLGSLFPGERATVTIRARATTPGELVFGASLVQPAADDEVIVAPDPTVTPDVQTRTRVRGCTRLGVQGADLLTGSAGHDVLCGLDGDDRLRPGRGRDLVLGGRGNDRVDSRDGYVDEVLCGSGLDSVVADRLDRVGRHCETVVRK